MSAKTGGRHSQNLERGKLAERAVLDVGDAVVVDKEVLQRLEAAERLLLDGRYLIVGQVTAHRGHQEVRGHSNCHMYVYVCMQVTGVV